MRFRILGPLRVRDVTGWVPVPADQQRVVLAVLLTHAGRVVSTDRLVDEIWGEQPPRTALKTVQAYVMRLRRALGDDAGSLLETRRHGYEMVLGDGDLDAREFQRLVAAGRRQLELGRPDAAAARMAEALALWRGPALADVPASPSLTTRVAQLELVRLAAVEDHLAALLDMGRHADVVDELYQLVDEHPLRERLWAHLMLALHRCHRRVESLETFHRARRVLVAELGLEPSARLRELQRMMLLAEDPQVTVPTASPPRVVPAQLPPDVTGFTGRDGQLLRLDAVLPANDDPTATAVAISAISGSAGVGKTAIAVHWAHRVRHRFPDGQLYVNLQGYGAGLPLLPVGVLARFLSALGVPADRIPTDEEEASALYRSLIAGKRLLVLLDNAAEADQVRPLLPGSAGCVVLVTSRNQLGGLIARDGAVRLALDVLNPAEAGTLVAFLLGAHRVPAGRAAVAELARLCGYLPLALRIAAANLVTHPHRTIEDYNRGLAAGDLLDALQVPGDPHAGVRAAFTLSYAALPSDSQRLFRLLALVPGPDVTAPAAAALVGRTSEEVARMLDGLAEAHLVNQLATGRFALHDLLRLYAAECAAAAETEPDRAAARASLIDYYLHGVCAAADLLYPVILRLTPAAGPLADPATSAGEGIDDVGASAWLDAERANLVAAVVHAADHGPRAAAWRLADALRGYLYIRGFTVDWAAVAAAGLAAAQADADLRAQAAAHLSLALLHFVEGRHELSEEQYTEALDLAIRAGWREGESAALGNLGNVFLESGRLPEAADHYSRALAIDEQTGWAAGQAAKLANLGLVEGELGQLTLAAAHLTQALELHRLTGSRLGEARNLANLGQAYRNLGRIDDALDLLTHALALHRELGDRKSEGGTATILASVQHDAGRVTEAHGLATTALVLAREAGNRNQEAEALTIQASIQFHRGRLREAIGGYQQALDLAQSIGNSRVETQALVGLAATHRASGHLALAAERAGDALAHARGAGYQTLEAQALTTLAVIHLRQGDAERALDAGDEALAIQTRTGDRLGQARTHLVVEAAHRTLGNEREAKRSRRRARTMFIQIGADWAENARLVLGDR